MLPIISIDERLKETKGIKGCIFGQSGIGKTSLLWTLSEDKTLFIDLEAGDLPVKQWKGDSLRPTTWQGLRDLAVFIAGFNPTLEKAEVIKKSNVIKDEDEDEYIPYSKKHYDLVCKRFGDPKQLDKYATIFIDSISQASTLSFRYCEQQPEARARSGSIDLRNVYGLHAKEMLDWVKHLQKARDKNIWFVGILDKKFDDYNIPTYSFQIEGLKTGLELAGIVDEILIMKPVIDEKDSSKTVRRFVCQTNNIEGLPAKDRSGALELYEKPHLGYIMKKIINSPRPTANSFTYN
ncbi:MAG: hypothetical protein C4617_05090 [Candidatus Liberibacter europaeus]|uniref:ATP-binding protein n=1 Tax=Candidatus Liberibacter europaeus TaxID=744859 RepID=A0A2T4VWJ4_9HYPH|nr:hypothetical protein [Candidatus Liberibacter europaeus]PTL86143.1 MAG: hypothetical protein C4617_05090 [Candidatus Liberibacter europaeus]